MIEYQHIELKTLDFKPKKIGDLLYSEGPILSHFIGDDGKQYLFTWVDNNDILNRWLIFEVTNFEFYLFFKGSLSLKDIILNKDFVYTLDLDANLESSRVQIVDKKNIPIEYLPSKDSFFDEDNYEPYSLKLREEVEHEIRFNHLIKNSLAKSFSNSTLIKPLIKNIDIPSFILFGHIQYLNTILITALIDSALNYELTREKRFEDIGFSIIDSYRTNEMSNMFMRQKFPIDKLQFDFYQFLKLYDHKENYRKNKYLHLTILLRSYYQSLSRKRELNWIDELEQQIVKELG